MYPVRLGFEEAVRRIQSLTDNGHYAEALVTTAFTTEKTLMRTLRQLIVSSGFRSKSADKLMGRHQGLEAIKNVWDVFDPEERSLISLIGELDWQTVKDCSTMRNKLVHGEKVYDLAVCRQRATDLLAALNRIRTKFDAAYGYSGWTTASRRLKSVLHIDPKV